MDPQHTQVEHRFPSSATRAPLSLASAGTQQGGAADRLNFFHDLNVADIGRRNPTHAKYMQNTTN